LLSCTPMCTFGKVGYNFFSLAPLANPVLYPTLKSVAPPICAPQMKVSPPHGPQNENPRTATAWCATVTLSLRRAILSDIWVQKMSISWNPGQRSLKVIGIDTDRSDAYDFLLTFHSSHGPISYRFRDKWRFQSKIAKFSNPRVLCAPAEGVPLELGAGDGVKKLEWWGYIPGRKRSLTISMWIYNSPKWQTDGRRDTGRLQRPRLRIASRGKNEG